ncbi:Ion channel regulatory protein UNC-93 [Popillia japonica]|uniref:UNC93-like protein MFSD11 n=1 Tax=Popillia japonica TaxID=7064 RepID=A0AAW1ISW4_POPJA
MIFYKYQADCPIKTILQNISDEDPNFTGDGYTSLAIIYAVFAVLNWSAPSVISIIGPKFAMVFGSVTYVLFILSFLVPRTWLLYVASVVIGIGAPMIWTGQGNYLTLCSTPATISRNSGVFWAMLQASMFIGNLFVYIQFQGLDKIDKSTRSMPKIEENMVKPADNRGPIQALKDAGKLFFTKNMLLLSITFFYMGVELSFYSGVYSPSIGFTKQLGDVSTQLVGLAGIFIGVGEVLGGALFGILGEKTVRWGRDPIIVGGFIVHVAAFFLIFLNLPNSSPFGNTTEEAFITTNAYLAIFCAFLLGLGDACFNTQVYSMLGDVFADDSPSGFAIYKFTQSVAAAACFFYSSYIGLYIQLGILLALAVFGTISFVLVEWSVKNEKSNSETSISSSTSDLESQVSEKYS